MQFQAEAKGHDFMSPFSFQPDAQKAVNSLGSYILQVHNQYRNV